MLEKTLKCKDCGEIQHYPIHRLSANTENFSDPIHKCAQRICPFLWYLKESLEVNIICNSLRLTLFLSFIWQKRPSVGIFKKNSRTGRRNNILKTQAVGIFPFQMAIVFIRVANNLGFRKVKGSNSHSLVKSPNIKIQGQNSNKKVCRSFCDKYKKLFMFIHAAVVETGWNG